MSRPICQACLDDRPCTGWAISEDDYGSTYQARCWGPAKNVRISTYTPDRHDKGDDE